MRSDHEWSKAHVGVGGFIPRHLDRCSGGYLPRVQGSGQDSRRREGSREKETPSKYTRYPDEGHNVTATLGSKTERCKREEIILKLPRDPGYKVHVDLISK